MAEKLTVFCLNCNIVFETDNDTSSKHFAENIDCVSHRITQLTKFRDNKRATKYACESCNFITSRFNDIKRHIKTDKHLTNLVSDTMSNIYACNKCDYVTSRSYNLKRHIDKVHKFDSKVSKKMRCLCGKQYAYKQSYIRHINDCIKYQNFTNTHGLNDNTIDLDTCSTELQHSNAIISQDVSEIINNYQTHKDEYSNTMKELLLTVLGDYKDLVSKAIEQPTVVNNSQTIKNQQNNNSFSIKNYLNTECKNAMNLSDYVSQIKITFDDLMYMKDHGLVKSFENTFVKGLKEMDQNMRPIHCSDVKRGNFYVKDEDTWTRDAENEKIIDTLKVITDQQCDVLKQWKLLNKDWLDNEVKQEHANIVTRKIVDIYGEKIQKQILNLLKQLNIEES
jgi:hypothetical protein